MRRRRAAPSVETDPTRFTRRSQMVRRIRPTYAGVTSTLALFLALGGGAYAAASLPAHSVGARQLKHNAVTRAAIKNGAVNGAKVANGSLTGADIRLSTLGKIPSAAA